MTTNSLSRPPVPEVAMTRYGPIGLVVPVGVFKLALQVLKRNAFDLMAAAAELRRLSPPQDPDPRMELLAALLEEAAA